MPSEESHGSNESQSHPLIEAVTLGHYQTNCYVVSVPGSDECWIVDASFHPHELVDLVRRRGLRPRAILLTHAHVDHIAGLDEVRRAFPGTPVLIHPEEANWLGNPMLNLSAMTEEPVAVAGADGTLAHGDTLELAGTRWEVRHTPGHSPGGVSFVHAASGQAIVGDALFAGSIGRTDFPGCSHETLIRSIREQLYTLPDETRVFPGHGPETTIGREKRGNPFVRG